MSPIVQALIASGTAGLISSLVLVVFVVPAVKRAIAHSYDKLLEQTKAESAIVQRRYDQASQALQELTLLYEDLLEDLHEFQAGSGDKTLSKILQELHPKYRRRFRMVRSKLEPTNDLLSFYSLSFDTLLHPDSVRRILGACETLKKPSDIKYAYRTIWLNTIECMPALLRVSTSHRFWDPTYFYQDRARAWAEHERKILEEHLIAKFSGKHDHSTHFSLKIEQPGGLDAFWGSMPTSNRGLNAETEPRSDLPAG